MLASWPHDITESSARACRSGASPAERLSLNGDGKGSIRAQLATPTCSQPGEKIPALLGPLSTILQRCVFLNAAVQQQATAKITEFQGRRAPTISIGDYLHRFAKYAKCSPVCFVMAESYLERLCRVDVALTPGPLNIHRLLTIGILLAAKLMDDRYYNNAYYAKIGGMSLDELNRLELRMMELLDFRLCVSKADICATLRQLTQQAAQRCQTDFVAAFKRLLLPAVAAGTVQPSSSGCAKGLALCTRPRRSALAASQHCSPVESQDLAQQEYAHVAVRCFPHSTAKYPSAISISQAEKAASTSGRQTSSSASCIRLQLGCDVAASTAAVSKRISQGPSKHDVLKPMSVRFSDQLQAADTSTLLTAAALCAASLEEPDSTHWRAHSRRSSGRSSSIASIASSAGSSCQRTVAQPCLTIGSVPAC